jgi:hypothetical protein
VARSTGTGFVNELWTNWSPAVTWLDVQVADFTGDGRADLAGRVASTGAWWAGVSSGAAFVNQLWTTWSPAVTWVNIQSGDFNGDGNAGVRHFKLQSPPC